MADLQGDLGAQGFLDAEFDEYVLDFPQFGFRHGIYLTEFFFQFCVVMFYFRFSGEETAEPHRDAAGGDFGQTGNDDEMGGVEYAA